jgi:hypothetical protein
MHYDETLMSCLLFIESQGHARSVTLKAFSYDETTKIMQNFIKLIPNFLFNLFISKYNVEFIYYIKRKMILMIIY